MPRRPLANLLSASTTDFPAAPAPGRVGTLGAGADRPFGPLLSARNFYIGLIVVSLVVGRAVAADPLHAEL